MLQLNSEMKSILEEIKLNPQVVAIAIAGSRAIGNGDSKSDYDVYIYCNNEDDLPEDIRNDIYSKYCSEIEVGNKYFEYEDNVVLNCGVPADIIFRSLDMIKNIQKYVVDDCGAMLGYTTAFWHTLKISCIYYDKTGEFTEIQKKYDIPYPEQLRKNIITKNMKMLNGVLPSYDKQIKKAVQRNDIVSICHRTTAYIESYFDVIFALNRMTHPGEKRLVDICKNKCSLLPKNFESNITRLYQNMYTGYDFTVLEEMYTNLKELVDANL